MTSWGNIERDETNNLMDNFHFDITARSKSVFYDAMKIAFSMERKAVGFVKVKPKAKDNKIVLFWHMDANENHGQYGDKVVPFPVELDWKAAADLVWMWLEKEAEYGSEPGHDGDNVKGYRVYNDSWGHIDGFSHRAFVAIEPAWAMLGK